MKEDMLCKGYFTSGENNNNKKNNSGCVFGS